MFADEIWILKSHLVTKFDSDIVKQCFLLEVKLNAIHTIITTVYLKLNEVINYKLFTTERRRSTKQSRLGFVIDSILITREA